MTSHRFSCRNKTRASHVSRWGPGEIEPHEMLYNLPYSDSIWRSQVKIFLQGRQLHFSDHHRCCFHFVHEQICCLGKKSSLFFLSAKLVRPHNNNARGVSTPCSYQGVGGSVLIMDLKYAYEPCWIFCLVCLPLNKLQCIYTHLHDLLQWLKDC